MVKSRYVLFVDNLSSVTRAKDLDYEFAACGEVRDVIKDSKLRCGLVEFRSSKDASAAWRRMDGFRMDGRSWKVDWATKEDFRLFGWKWFESNSPPPRKARSPSRSPPRSPSRSRSRSASPSRKDSPSEKEVHESSD